MPITIIPLHNQSTDAIARGIQF